LFFDVFIAIISVAVVIVHGIKCEGK